MFIIFFKDIRLWDFPGKTPCSRRRGPGINLWSGKRFNVLQLRVRTPQLKVLHTATKTEDPECCNEDPVHPNRYFLKKKEGTMPGTS